MKAFRRRNLVSASVHRVAIVALAAYLLSAPSAHAYLDPGTGSMILQAIAAAIISVGVFWRGIVTKVRMMFARAPRPNAEQPKKDV